MSDKEPLIGQQLDEYYIEALLGRGGMARVYRALDIRLKRYAAVKVVDMQFQAQPDYIRRFELEAQAVARLEHPHIVHLYRCGEADGLLYIAMQYIEGSDLGHVLATYRQDQEFIESEDASRIIQQACLALDYAHGQGVIHRDVKPSNIMLNKQGQVFLTDFGLALLTEVGTRGEIFGSPHYIAPEQVVSSANALPQSDLYAIGVILYEMFTGSLPFDAPSPLDIAMQHLSEPLRPPRQLRPDISPAVEAVILKALNKTPEERYPSGFALSSALDQALQATSTQSPRPLQGSRLTIPERIALDKVHPPLPPSTSSIPAPPTPSLSSLPPSTIEVKPKEASPMPTPPAQATATASPTNAQANLDKDTIPSARPQATPTQLSQAQEDKAGSGQRWPIYLIGLVGAGAILTILLCGLAGMWLWLGRTSPSPTPASGLLARTSPPVATLHTLPGASSPTPPAAPPQVLPSPQPDATFTLVPTPTDYQIEIIIRGEENLFVVNRSQAAFPLGPLRLTADRDDDDQRGEISGADWKVDTLNTNQCVVAGKKEGGKARPSDAPCTQTGEKLTREGKAMFWKSGFRLYYNTQLIGACKEDMCRFAIPTQ